MAHYPVSRAGVRGLRCDRVSRGMRAASVWERRSWVWLLLAASLFSYANGLTGGFTYDDKAVVRDDARIQSWQNLPEIFTTQYFGGSLKTGTAYRPIDLLSLAANFAISGRSTWSYHFVNLGFHIADVWLLFVLLRRRFGEVLAGVAALLFACMPVHVEAVTSIVGRAETLAAFFVLLAFFAAERARRERFWRGTPFYIAACCLYLLANLTKESAVVFPGLLFLYDMLEEEGGFFQRFGARLRHGALFYCGFFIPLAATFGIRFLVLKGFLISKFAGVFALENPLVSLHTFARVGNACAVLLRGLGRIIFPLYLSADESAWQLPLLQAASPLFWLSLLAVAALLVAGIALFRKRPASGFGLLLFLLAILPTTNFLFVIGTIMAERLLYLPSAGIALVLADFFVGRAESFWRLRWRAAALAALMVFFIGRTIVRNTVWQSDEALFSNLIATSPGSAKAHYNFAYEAADRREFGLAYAHYRKATEIFPDYYDAWAGRGRIAGELGNLEEAVSDAKRSTRIFPTYENGWFTAASAAERRGDFAGAEKDYRQGFEKCPHSYPLAYHLAAMLARRGEFAPAVAAYKKALTLEPNSSLCDDDLGRLYFSRGDVDKAEDFWGEALATFSTDGTALSGLARLSEQEGDWEEAAHMRIRLFEADHARSDLILLLRAAARSPVGAQKARARWNKWKTEDPKLFADPEVVALGKQLPDPGR